MQRACYSHAISITNKVFITSIINYNLRGYWELATKLPRALTLKPLKIMKYYSNYSRNIILYAFFRFK